MERKVSRKYDVSLQENVLTWWRDDPAFSQRFTCTISSDGDVIVIPRPLPRAARPRPHARSTGALDR